MYRGLLIVLAVALAGSAAAQTTSCGWEMGKWVCRQEHRLVAPPPVDASHIFENGMRAQDEAYARARRYDQDREARAVATSERQTAQTAQIMARIDADNRNHLREIVSKAVSEGRCDDAKALALKYSDMDLAEQAVQLCAPK